MLRYLEEERYSCTCDICGKAKHFYTNSKRKAMKNAWNLGYHFVVVNGVTYCLCSKCANKPKLLKDFCRSEREAVKRFNRSKKVEVKFGSNWQFDDEE